MLALPLLGFFRGLRHEHLAERVDPPGARSRFRHVRDLATPSLYETEVGCGVALGGILAVLEASARILPFGFDVTYRLR